MKTYLPIFSYCLQLIYVLCSLITWGKSKELFHIDGLMCQISTQKGVEICGPLCYCKFQNWPQFEHDSFHCPERQGSSRAHHGPSALSCIHIEHCTLMFQGPQHPNLQTDGKLQERAWNHQVDDTTVESKSK